MRYGVFPLGTEREAHARLVTYPAESAFAISATFFQSRAIATEIDSIP
jgi:hypothetical protein